MFPNQHPSTSPPRSDYIEYYARGDDFIGGTSLADTMASRSSFSYDFAGSSDEVHRGTEFVQHWNLDAGAAMRNHPYN